MASQFPGMTPAFTNAGSTPQFSKKPAAPLVTPYAFAMAIIDGTGALDDDDYASEMAQSFCKQIGKTPASNAVVRYWRGPSLDGVSTGPKGIEAMEWLVKCRDAGAQKLFLAGYSRGGTSAVVAAQNLARRDIAVDGIFLFDPVDRSLAMTFGLPKNVKMSRTAYRDTPKKLVDKYEDSIGWGQNPMRPSFGNLDVTPGGPGDHILRKDFTGSHGALGGVGWSHVSEDSNCQASVAMFMNEGFLKLGLPFKIASISTPNNPPKKETENKPQFKKFEMPKFERGPKY